MGILKFFNYIKNNYNKSDESPELLDCITTYKYIVEKKYDYLFLDFQSLIYSSYGVFCSEFNYLLRLLAYCHIKAHQDVNVLNNNIGDVKIHKIIMYLLNKYNDWIELCSPLFTTKKTFFNVSTTLSQIKTNTQKILSIDYKNSNNIIEYLTNIVVDLTTELAEKQIKTDDSYAKTYIYFDGIPSIAKIKEQIGRRMFGDIITIVKNDAYDITPELTDPTLIPIQSFIKTIKQIELLLLPTFPPSIGVGTDTVRILRIKLQAINDSIKGRFIINSVSKYGEAEHQLMKFIYSNKTLFQSKKVLLASPDADLILLCLIASTENINIDLLRVTPFTENNFDFRLSFGKQSHMYSPFYKENTYINIVNLKKNLKFTTKQKTLDLCFAMLLLGDDFIPTIPTVSVIVVKNIINAYDTILLTNSEFTLVNKSSNLPTSEYKINPTNLLLFLKEIIQLKSNGENLESTFETKVIEKHNNSVKNGPRNIKKSFEKLINMYFYAENKVNSLGYKDFEKYKVTFYIENGYKLEIDGKLSNLIQKRERTPPTPVDKLNDKVTNYLQGCQFILDIYLNNSLKNYKWHYKYNDSPTIMEIITFMTGKSELELNQLFDYTNGGTTITSNTLKYLNATSYRTYSGENKEKIIKSAIKKINPSENVSDTTVDLAELKRKYFTLSNVEKIVNCHNKQYFNKCIEVDELVPNEEYTNKEIRLEQLGGYYKKYLKYKQKYIELKTKLN
jgi:hypothetical protein